MKRFDFRRELKELQEGDLVTQHRGHRSRVGSDWGIGTVIEADAVYIRVFWPRWNKVFSMNRLELEFIDAESR